MGMFFVCVVMGLVPMIVYAAMLWWIDHWEREPLWMVVGAFLWGAVPAVVVAGIMQVVTMLILFGKVDSDPTQITPQTRFLMVILAPLTEEICKGALLGVIFLFFSREIDSVLDGLVYGAMIGFGFAAVENIGYFFTIGSQEPAALVPLIALRAFAFGPIHAMFTGMTGLGFALARFQRNPFLKFVFPMLGLILAMLLHATHNFFATLELPGIALAMLVNWSGIFWVGVLVIVSLLYQRRAIEQQMVEEVSLGVLTPAQAHNAASFGTMVWHGLFPFLFWLPPRSRSRKLNKLCADLAFKKHQLAKMGEEWGNHSAVEELRAQVAHMSQQALA